MPLFNIFDMFCLPGTDLSGGIGTNIDFSGGSVVDPMAVNANASPSGDPIIEIGTVLNGSAVTNLGTVRFDTVDCDGNAEDIKGWYFETADGSVYMNFPAEGVTGAPGINTLNINNGTITGINTGTQRTIDDYEVNDNHTVCVCFTAGMMIETDKGPVAVEDLVEGDMVKTYDNGFQPLRYMYRRTVSANGSNTPVLFKAGAIGNSHDLIVSQKHRMFTGTLPKRYVRALDGNDDHLVHAEKLVNGSTIRMMPELETVEYFHMMFANHELVWCQNTVSESWQPTQKALKNAPEVADELLSIFPELATATGQTPGALSRIELNVSTA